MLKNQDEEEFPEQLDILLIPAGKHLQNLIKSPSNCFKVSIFFHLVFSQQCPFNQAGFASQGFHHVLDSVSLNAGESCFAP